MTPRPTPDESQRPTTVDPDLLERLCAIANRAVADQIHADQCACDGWPQNCVSGYSAHTWETGAWEIGLPAVLAELRTNRAVLDGPAGGDR